LGNLRKSYDPEDALDTLLQVFFILSFLRFSLWKSRGVHVI
jgi:hypothetical protein